MYRSGSPLLAHSIHKLFPNTNVYINDHLSARNRKWSKS